ncbi:uncharacterized protein LOC100141684 [Tribolium castaneum]|uniref:F-box domain-containing protein n=1 Tax=Tribolium castaneum TaxID=7070 RepID=D2A637_TRICA|nr:PREDICTED: uncharacterized protein LOC100141684 [Tribolium castaneum]EFA04984.1 hypothetical protein TcasGA2_TC015062 [Tribolium castaneum]|eukprot:XP_001813192.1 PREDICTED: uncharacterized protein LOC100141684 [Tribolium castaneum]
MDLTPPKDSKGPFSHASTPLTHFPRKRKHDDTFESPKSPPFSSTLNESLITDLKDICLVGSVPNTPEKQLSFLAQTVVSSPIQESRKILYGSIKVVKPERDRRCSFRNKYLPVNNQKLLQRILNINVIMDVIFRYLSGGDLYRFSLVSPSFCKALEASKDAFLRYQVYKDSYKDNKENYVITPPGSPDKPDSPPRTSSVTFNKFLRAASRLKGTQTLRKCDRCSGVAVVDHQISQCQNVHSCGLIRCLLCSSFSETGHKDFKDACGHASFRPSLGNMSNTMEDSSSNFSSQDSGFYSENESPVKVKRILFQNVDKQTSNGLSLWNKNQVVVTYKKNDSLSYIPVVANDTPRREAAGDSPPSPQRHTYAVGSKQSKRNLKRLTR